jgi:3-oxoacyl-[acyl-carrier protein] reductase
MFRLDQKVALVTGASRGIGRAIAIAFAAHGARVVVHYATNRQAADDVVKIIADEGGEAELVSFDVAQSAAVEAEIAAVEKRHGKLDILVANAGIAVDGLALRLNDDDLDRLWQTNVRGSLIAAKAALKTMLRPKQGRIVFVSSVVGEMGNAGQTAYAASKAALLGASKSLAREFASRNITVNVVSPGFIDTDMTARLSDAQREQLTKVIPLGKTGAPEDVAAACVYLASDAGRYVTGQVLRVNGGLYM